MTARPQPISTRRLQLLALLPAEIEALVVRDAARASQLLGARFPDGFPDDAAARSGLSWHLRHLRADATEVPWRIRVMVEVDSGMVIGSINAKGPPDPRGDVEIGWGVSTTHRRRGFAFEAAGAVIGWSTGQPRVRTVSARVPDDNEASGRLAAKLGMARTAVLRDGLPVWQLRLRARPSASGE